MINSEDHNVLNGVPDDALTDETLSATESVDMSLEGNASSGMTTPVNAANTTSQDDLRTPYNGPGGATTPVFTAVNHVPQNVTESYDARLNQISVKLNLLTDTLNKLLATSANSAKRKRTEEIIINTSTDPLPSRSAGEWTLPNRRHKSKPKSIVNPEKFRSATNNIFELLPVDSLPTLPEEDNVVMDVDNNSGGTSRSSSSGTFTAQNESASNSNIHNKSNNLILNSISVQAKDKIVAQVIRPITVKNLKGRSKGTKEPSNNKVSSNKNSTSKTVGNTSNSSNAADSNRKDPPKPKRVRYPPS